jgi:hypothetical protein
MQPARRRAAKASVHGELFPIVAISLFLTRRGEFVALVSILAGVWWPSC